MRNPEPNKQAKRWYLKDDKVVLDLLMYMHTHTHTVFYKCLQLLCSFYVTFVNVGQRECLMTKRNNSSHYGKKFQVEQSSCSPRVVPGATSFSLSVAL